MEPVRRIIAIVWIVVGFVANAGERPAAEATGAAKHATHVDLQLLQGKWEGVLVGDDARQKITVTITGDSLRFHRDTNFWFETTIILRPGKEPKLLHATIKDCPPSQGVSIGQIVRAFYRIGEGTLTLATMGDDADETPKGFEAAGTRYELRKVQRAAPANAVIGEPNVGRAK